MALDKVANQIIHESKELSKCRAKNSYQNLMEVLETKASQSKTTQWWVENLVKPIFIMMLFVRAEREVDWPLHLWAVKEMIPYFFAAGHWNYARYATYYLHSMEKLSKKVFRCFMKGEHVMRHKPGYTEQCATSSNQTQTARVYQNATALPANTKTDPMLFQCWSSAVGGGPILKQHWVKSSRLLGSTQVSVYTHPAPTIIFSPADQGTFSKTAGQSQAYYNT